MSRTLLRSAVVLILAIAGFGAARAAPQDELLRLEEPRDRARTRGRPQERYT